MHAKKIANLYDMAMKMGAPVIGLIDCAGLRLQEATDALNAFGEVYLKQTLASGVVPQITAVFGMCGGGAAIIPNLTDITLMTKEGSKLFVNSPNTLDENRTEKLDTAAAEYVAVNTANVDAVYDTEAELLGAVRTLVELLPSNNEDEKDGALCEDDVNRIIPDLASKAGDVKAVIADITDDEFVFELKKDFADDVVTAFIRLNGETVGVVGNQKDVLTTAGAYKAEDFVKLCDAFNIPVLTLVNVAGLAATVKEEKTISKAVAKLTYAYANATVPKVTVMLDKAYGTAYTAMCSKAIGADMVFAWSKAVIGTMDPEMAVKIMYEDEIAAAGDKLSFSLPTADEWSYLCGGGCRTLFPWGDGLDYSMRLRWFEDMDEDENRPYDMEEPNFFGLSIAYDPYMREVVQADRLTTCGGDGGCNICGGLGPFLGFLPCSPHCKPEVQEDNELNGDYDFYRPIIRLENYD
mgnify:CR=1 FL=1